MHIVLEQHLGNIAGVRRGRVIKGQRHHPLLDARFFKEYIGVFGAHVAYEEVWRLVYTVERVERDNEDDGDDGQDS